MRQQQLCCSPLTRSESVPVLTRLVSRQGVGVRRCPARQNKQSHYAHSAPSEFGELLYVQELQMAERYIPSVEPLEGGPCLTGLSTGSYREQFKGCGGFDT